MNKRIRQALITYARDHKAAGSFVMACLENNFAQAVTRADDANFLSLREIAKFLYNELPSQCWGSRGAVEDWLKLPGPTPLPDLNEKEWRDYP